MFSKRAFIIPFIIFLTSFTIDKLILLDSFIIYYLTTASFINFEHKERLVFELKEYLNKPKTERKKVMVILGNSRSMSFDNEYIAEKYPDWILFNFSVPGGTQDYFYYIMQKFKTFNIKPEAIYFTVTPQAMNSTPNILTDEVMVFGLPFEFVLKHFYYYKVDELTNYIGKKLFVVYKYRPKFNVIQSRLQPENLLKFTTFLINTHHVLEENKGNIPSKHDFKINVSNEFLERNAESIWKDFFVPFTLNENAVYFLEKCIEVSKDLNIKHIALLWPQVSPQLKAHKKNLKIAKVKENGKIIYKTVYEVWAPEMIHLAEKYQVKWVDLNFTEIQKCNDFFDASHLASNCYPEYTDILFTNLK